MSHLSNQAVRFNHALLSEHLCTVFISNQGASCFTTPSGLSWNKSIQIPFKKGSRVILYTCYLVTPECGRPLPTTSRAQPSLCLSVATSPPPLPATYPTSPPQPTQPLQQEKSRVNGKHLSDQNMLHSDQVIRRKPGIPPNSQSQNTSTLDAPKAPPKQIY